MAMKPPDIPPQAEAEILEVIGRQMYISSDELATILKRHGVTGDQEQLQTSYRKRIGQRFIASILDQEGVLLNSSQFETVLRFQSDGLTCLYFPFREIELDMGKLALWRLNTHDLFGGTWLSDYVPNRLGGFLEEPAIQRPNCPLLICAKCKLIVNLLKF